MDDEFFNKVEKLIGNLTVTVNGVEKLLAEVSNVEIRSYPEHDACENLYFFLHDPPGLPTTKTLVPNCIHFRPPLKKELKKLRGVVGQSCPYLSKRCKFKSFVERKGRFYVVNKQVGKKNV